MYNKLENNPMKKIQKVKGEGYLKAKIHRNKKKVD
jgi:hypothetical protein